MRMGELLVRVLFSPASLGLRTLWTALIILYLYGVINMAYFDVANFGVCEDYIVAMLIFALVGGLLASLGVRRYFHDKSAEKQGYDNPFDLPYDKRYDFGTAVAFICSVAIAMVTTGIIVNAVFLNAGLWTHAFVCGGWTMLLVVALTTMYHFGIRKWLIKVKDYFIGLVDTVQEVVTDVKDKLDDGEINGSVSGGTEVTDAINGAVNTASAKTTDMAVKVKKG